ncbi:MAG: TonB-dependent receptor plug domain-containing protein [Bacteroidales bacterium]|nr:TonB-dependent receptor plug domain-containing protein [Bacteroidales bacterium]
MNIPEALRLAPGIIVRQKTNGNYDVHIRGNDNVPPGKYLFDSENTISLVMIDNRPVYNNFQGGIFWEALPIDIEDIKKIEMVTGQAPALYGPNAVTGAINIITIKPGAEELQIHSDVQYGNANTRKAYVSVNKDLTQRLSARLSANYQQRDRFQDEYLNFSDYEYYPSDSLPGIISNAPERYEDPMLAINNQGLTLPPAMITTRNCSSILQQECGNQNTNHHLDINNFVINATRVEDEVPELKGQWHNLKAMVAFDKGLQDNAVDFMAISSILAIFHH